MIYGDYEVIEMLGRKGNNRYYKLKCKICGHIKECSQSNLQKQDNSHSPRNCQYDYYRGLIGKKFGDYICTDILKNNRGYRAALVCDVCGNTANIHANAITEKYHSGNNCTNLFHKKMIGKVFGDLEIIELSGYKHHTMLYKCKCVKCGIESKQTLASLKKEIKHGEHCLLQIPNTPIKKAIVQRHANMKQRCENKHNKNFEHYGKRNVKLLYEHSVDLYLDFAKEFERHAEKYGLRNSTFDRIDVNGNYDKDNLRITTQTIQSTNTTRKTIFIIQKGKEKILSDSYAECGRYLGINGRAIGNLVRGKSKTSYGWKLCRIVEKDKNLENVSIEEGVTTKLIAT